MKRSKRKWLTTTRVHVEQKRVIEPGYLLEHPLDDEPEDPPVVEHEAWSYAGRSYGFAGDRARAGLGHVAVGQRPVSPW